MLDASAKMVQSSKILHMNIKEKTKKADGRNRRGSSKIQAAKSEAMRQQLLQTTVTCFATMPYSEVSAVLIAEKAGVSRGGMQYHFPTRLDMLQATVRYLHARRLEIFRNDLQAVPEGVSPVDHMIDSHWRNLNEAEFRAYQELVLAGRSEPELHELLTTTYRAFINEWHEIAHSIIGWEYSDPQVARSSNIAHYLLDGMAFGRLGGQLNDEEVTELLDYTKQLLRRPALSPDVNGCGSTAPTNKYS